MEMTRPVYWGMVRLCPSAWSGGRAAGAAVPRSPKRYFTYGRKDTIMTSLFSARDSLI